MMAINFINGDSLAQFPRVANSMFRHRAEQFHRRLGWDVNVDSCGLETDQYDELNPVYIIAVDNRGFHQGSMRYLPTLGRTMVNEHFLYLTDGVRIESPLIWECTRFCLAPGAPRNTAAKLLAAGGKMMRANGLKHYVGVFDAFAERAYRRAGAAPTVISEKTTSTGKIGVGLWEFTDPTYDKLLEVANYSRTEMDLFYEVSCRPISDEKLPSIKSAKAS
ncbi:MAG: autoinducer synthase [Pelagimonas sp.]|jgi:acyl homoserine lactone synthase|nr:autoinducer synthase [Pelagimonas sp.]